LVEVSEGQSTKSIEGDSIDFTKPFFIGSTEVMKENDEDPLPEFSWKDLNRPIKHTPMYETHKDLGAKLIPFAGWELPVWYTSVLDEHRAVRNAVGVFDVAHMGVYQVEGPDAVGFLDCVVGNDIGGLDVGESCYTHMLDHNANVIDDLLVYHRGKDIYLMVVNAANDDKDWAWLNAVKEGRLRVDEERPWAKAFGRKAILRNLRDPKEGDDMRVDISLQGPRSREILLALGSDEDTRKRILALKRTQLTEGVLGGFDLVISRTGYTGEKMAFELFVHPDRAAELFRALLRVGESFGIKSVGLGARDSLRTEAGLPLYGHEMGAGSGQIGEGDLGVAEAGFGSYVKVYKPWFIGREAYLEREKNRKGIVVRFRFNEKGVRMAHNGDPVMDKRGRVIGWVTSCAVDRDGYLTGQAYIDQKHSSEDSSIYIFQSAPGDAGKAPADLTIGDRSLLANQAKVVSRFPK